MTTTTKALLGISILGFAVGCTDLFWGLGRPVGAIFLGLFMLSKILEKEAALFDEEERLRVAQALRNQASRPAREESVPQDRPNRMHRATAH